MHLSKSDRIGTMPALWRGYRLPGRAYGALGAGGTIFGVAGWGDDARAWARWAEMNPGEAGILIGAGGVMFITYLVWEVTGVLRRWKSMQQETAVLPVRTEEIWHVEPSAGRTVAQAIREAPTLERARAIFDAHYASPNPKDTAWAAYALMTRMESAGEDIMPLTHKLLDEGIDMTEHLEEFEEFIGTHEP